MRLAEAFRSTRQAHSFGMSNMHLRNSGDFVNFQKLKVTSDQMLHVDLMRFVASLGIVIHHSHEFFFPVAERIGMIAKMSSLAIFVDLFFIYSGFVISHVYNNRINSPVDYINFLQRRVGRLVPLHWLTLIISILIWSMLTMLHFQASHTPSFEPECILETAFLLHSFMHCGNDIFFNSVSWSVSAEMVLYIVFPVLAIIGYKSGLSLLLVAFMLVICLFTIVLTVTGQNVEAIQPIIRAIPSFAFGAALFYNREFVSQIPRPQVLLFVSVIMTFIFVLIGASQLTVLFLIYIVAVSTIAADLQRQAAIQVRQGAPLGQLTYSIYMWHPILIFIIMNLIGDKLLHANYVTMIGISIICYAIIIFVSYLSFFYIEGPARRWVDGIRLFGAKPGTYRSPSE